MEFVMKNKGVKVFIYIFLSVFLLIQIFPIVWMLSSSLKYKTDIYAVPWSVIPKTFYWQNYINAWNMAIKSYLVNSIIVAVTVTVSNVLIASLTAYALAKFDFKGRDLFFKFVLLTVMIPVDIMSIPMFQQIKSFGLLNSHIGIAAPFLVTGFSVFLMRQGIASIPNDYLEAARVDGYSEIFIFLRIVMPMSAPYLAAMTIFTFLTNWDNYLWPLIAATNQKLYTVPIGLSSLASAKQYLDNGALLAGSVIAILSVFIMFLFFQKQIMYAAMGSGVKG